MQANAVIFTAPNTVEYAAVTCPDPGPSDVVVRVTQSWISNGTEGSFLRGERIEGDTPYSDESDPWPFPIVAGYQKIGIVEWVGSEIDDLKLGETVFCTMGKVEGMYSARAGQVSPSVSGRDGIWKLPAGVEPLAFAGLVLAQVGYNAGTRPRLGIGDGAIVIGDGLVGQWSAQTLAWRGAEVLMVGRHNDRLEKFARAPYGYTVNAREEDWIEKAKALFPQGAQAAIDTIGSIEVVEQLQGVLRRNGHLVSAGFYGTQDRLALQPPRYGEFSIDLVSGWQPQRMDETLHLIASGHLQTLPLITHHFPVAKAADAWALIEGKSEPMLGIILDWE
jgi:2-desacetyl-2-hydroxyethyl bacteriochlorophyllide A dehydrogenase